MIYISIALLIPIESLSKDTQTQHLFKIERSKNANIVQYDVQKKADCKPVGDDDLLTNAQISGPARIDYTSDVDGFNIWKSKLDKIIL